MQRGRAASRSVVFDAVVVVVFSVVFRSCSLFTCGGTAMAISGRRAYAICGSLAVAIRLPWLAWVLLKHARRQQEGVCVRREELPMSGGQRSRGMASMSRPGIRNSEAAPALQVPDRRGSRVHKNKNKRGPALAEASRKHPRDQLLLSLLSAARCQLPAPPPWSVFSALGTREGKMEMVTSSRPANGRDQTGSFWGFWHAKPGDCASLQGCNVWTARPGRIHQSDLPTAQEVAGSQAPTALSEHQPKALTEGRWCSFQFSMSSSTFHLRPSHSITGRQAF